MLMSNSKGIILEKIIEPWMQKSYVLASFCPPVYLLCIDKINYKKKNNILKNIQLAILKYEHSFLKRGFMANILSIFV